MVDPRADYLNVTTPPEAEYELDPEYRDPDLDLASKTDSGLAGLHGKSADVSMRPIPTPVRNKDISDNDNYTSAIRPSHFYEDVPHKGTITHGLNSPDSGAFVAGSQQDIQLSTWSSGEYNNYADYTVSMCDSTSPIVRDNDSRKQHNPLYDGIISRIPARASNKELGSSTGIPPPSKTPSNRQLCCITVLVIILIFLCVASLALSIFVILHQKNNADSIDGLQEKYTKLEDNYQQLLIKVDDLNKYIESQEQYKTFLSTVVESQNTSTQDLARLIFYEIARVNSSILTLLEQDKSDTNKTLVDSLQNQSEQFLEEIATVNSSILAVLEHDKSYRNKTLVDSMQNQREYFLDEIAKVNNSIMATVDQGLSSVNQSLAESLNKQSDEMELKMALVNHSVVDLAQKQSYLKYNISGEVDDIHNNLTSQLVHVEATLWEGIMNVSKMVGPQGQRGPPGIGDLSRCRYESQVTIRSGISKGTTTTDLSPPISTLETHIVMAASCSVEGGTSANLEAHQALFRGVRHQYRCLCTGDINGQNQRECILHLWLCPITTNK